MTLVTMEYLGFWMSFLSKAELTLLCVGRSYTHNICAVRRLSLQQAQKSSCWFSRLSVLCLVVVGKELYITEVQVILEQAFQWGRASGFSNN